MQRSVLRFVCRAVVVGHPLETYIAWILAGCQGSQRIRDWHRQHDTIINFQVQAASVATTGLASNIRIVQRTLKHFHENLANMLVIQDDDEYVFHWDRTIQKFLANNIFETFSGCTKNCSGPQLS
jgi:hypothetical protein